MLVYLYDELRVYTESQETFEDPRNPGSFLIPENAVDFAPPSPGADQVAQLAVDLSAWQLVFDYRGTYYDKTTQDPYEITDLGVIPASNLTSVAPPVTNAEYYEWNETQGDWVRNDTLYKAGLETKITAVIIQYGDDQASTLAFPDTTAVERQFYTLIRKQAEDLRDAVITYTQATLLYKIAGERNGTATPTEQQVLDVKDEVVADIGSIEDTVAHVKVRVETLMAQLPSLSITDLETYDVVSRW